MNLGGPVNTTKIFDALGTAMDNEEVLELATWYGTTDTKSADVPDEEKVKFKGTENQFTITYGEDAVTIYSEELTGLKYMLDEYDNWLNP